MLVAQTTSPVVLVVEDEPSVQGSLCRLLQHHGFAPLHAETVKAALKILGRTQVDAVILDLGLPHPGSFKPSGLTLLTYLRLTPHYDTLPVLIVTGKTLTPEEQDVIRRYHASLFYKPQAYETLVESLYCLIVQHPPAA